MPATLTHQDSKLVDSSDYPVHSPWESVTSLFSSSSSSSTSKDTVRTWTSSITSDPVLVGVLSAAAAAGLTVGGLTGYRRYWRRIRNADYVTSGMLDRKKWVKGIVTSVGDGDNFRLFHTPGIFYSYPFKFRSIPKTPKGLKDETIHVRISGVDAPELAHFGNPAQPHGQESLDWLKATILRKRMKVQLLRKDQYSRIVGVPYIRRWYWKDKPLPLMMLREGMAVVYESGGAEYGPWGIEGMKAAQRQAEGARRGLWSLKKMELPGNYKKRMKNVDAEGGMAGVKTTARKERSGGVWEGLRRFFTKPLI